MKDKSSINLKKSMGRGSLEHETRESIHEGEIMTLATKEVITISPSTTIKGTSEIMAKHKFRRLPVTDPGSGRILGIVTSMDILNFLGGGDKFNLMEKKHQDNFLAAINEHIKAIMTKNVFTISTKDTIASAIKIMIEKDVGALPIVDENDKIVGIITERDIALSLNGVMTEELVKDYMVEDVITTTPGTPIEGATKIMFRNKLRRIPILGKEDLPHAKDETLVGILTANDILKYFGEKELIKNIKSNSGMDILNAKVSEVMKKDVVTVEPLTRIGDLCELLAEKNTGGVPVVKDGKIQGIITERDVLKTIDIN
ncbi:MAG: CBS domain-containing protein [Methanobrevibacter sp.]|jgi:CBS domain-containing protein|nr:CBS domain-containing protein [Candidatus Methanoflexus mossambicus]